MIWKVGGSNTLLETNETMRMKGSSIHHAHDHDMINWIAMHMYYELMMSG